MTCVRKLVNLWWYNVQGGKKANRLRFGHIGVGEQTGELFVLPFMLKVKNFGIRPWLPCRGGNSEF